MSTEKVEMRYYVPDVEHDGDIRAAIGSLREMGAEVYNKRVEYGSEEIEEAVLYIRVNKEDVPKFEDYGCY